MSLVSYKKNYTAKTLAVIRQTTSSIQTIPAFATTTITMPTNDTPTSTELYSFSNANSITIKYSGWYKCSFQWISIGNAITRDFRISKTGSTPAQTHYITDSLASAVNGFSSGTGVAIILCQPGDIIKVQCYTETAFDMGFGAFYTVPKLAVCLMTTL
jgi:hypothetical protein